MRAESDLEGHHRSDGTPACHRCGFPLLEEAEFCPYCERWLNERTFPRLLRRRGSAGRGRGRRVAGVPERLLLGAGLVVFGLVAAASLVAAFLA